MQFSIKLKIFELNSFSVRKIERLRSDYLILFFFHSDFDLNQIRMKIWCFFRLLINISKIRFRLSEFLKLPNWPLCNKKVKNLLEKQQIFIPILNCSFFRRKLWIENNNFFLTILSKINWLKFMTLLIEIISHFGISRITQIL